MNFPSFFQSSHPKPKQLTGISLQNINYNIKGVPKNKNYNIKD